MACATECVGRGLLLRGHEARLRDKRYQAIQEDSDAPFANYAVDYNAAKRKVTFWPETPPRRGTTYKAVVSTRAQDLAGNPLDQRPNHPGDQPKVWYFTIEE